MDALQAYRQSEISDNPIHLVVLLYDQLLRDIQRALDAFQRHDIPGRCRELDHALVVLGQLQGTLNLEQGGEAAANLDRFYNLIRDSLVRASVDGSPELLKHQWQNILGVREAWLEVERQQSKAPATSANSRPVTNEQHAEIGKSEWSA